jgi:hypothetical protein
MYPTGILLNKLTNRYHPISFRVSPRPSDDMVGGSCRYKSVGHHTDGFDTQAEAEAFIEKHAENGAIAMGAVWEWDGVELPAMVMDLPYPYPTEKAS